MGVQPDRIELKVAANVKIDITKSAVAVILEGSRDSRMTGRIRLSQAEGDMKKGLRWKLILTLGVMALAIFLFFPPER